MGCLQCYIDLPHGEFLHHNQIFQILWIFSYNVTFFNIHLSMKLLYYSSFKSLPFTTVYYEYYMSAFLIISTG